MQKMKTLAGKLWDAHVVVKGENAPDLMYVDLHLIHEVTSPQAFEALRMAGRKVRRPDLSLATMDHNTPTRGGMKAAGAESRKQIEQLVSNCQEAGIVLHKLGSRHQGIVHMIGPELGLTQPGKLIVCGDSHTSTHGAFGALAFGIGTSEVELVLASQCLWQMRPKDMVVNIEGELPRGVSAKDVILAVIGKMGVSGGAGCAVEYRGSTIEGMSMEARMTVCNMSIEWGAKAGMVASDEVTYKYLEGRKHAPKGKAWEEALDYWRSLKSEEGAQWDRILNMEAGSVEPQVTWGTNPGQVVSIKGRVPEAQDESVERALAYMDLKSGMMMEEVQIDRVFIGSCTNARIEDLRSAASIVAGRRVKSNVRAMVVPGSTMVKAEAEKEGLDKVFLKAGFEWRDAGCSMCLGMNEDILLPGERCASTSNRNFEGRQGAKGRTHLMSPAMAAAAAVTGHLVDVREWE